jgi:hypothetical protein
MVGTSCRYAPVEVLGDLSLRRKFVDVIAGDAAEGRVQARRADR